MIIEGINDIVFLLLGSCLVLFIVFIFVMKYIVEVHIPFASERDYILRELERSRGKERETWENELKLLHMSRIPFIGASLVKKCRDKEEKRNDA